MPLNTMLHLTTTNRDGDERKQVVLASEVVMIKEATGETVLYLRCDPMLPVYVTESYEIVLRMWADAISAKESQ